MSAHAYTEDQLVEQPAIGLFAELGWTPVWAWRESFGAPGTLLRGTKAGVVLGSRWRAALGPAGRPWVEIQGGGAGRTRRAIDAVTRLLATG